MTIYIYRNHITDSTEAMDDLIFNMLSEGNQFPSDKQCATEYEDKVEEEQASAHDIFLYMRNGFIFEAHCGTEPTSNYKKDFDNMMGNPLDKLNKLGVIK